MSESSRRLQASVGVALLAAYAVPLFVPPEAVAAASPAPDASLLARLFPGIPAAWIGLRLLALALGAGLLAAAAPSLPSLRLPEQPARARAPTRGALVASVAVLAILLAVIPFAGRLGRAGELLWLLGLATPALLLAWGERRSSAGALVSESELASRAAGRRGLGIALAIAVPWLTLRLAQVHHSPRMADAIDLWHAHQWLLETIRDGTNVITALGQSGLHQTYMLGLGVSFMGAGRGYWGWDWEWVPTLFETQLLHGLWLLASAALVGALAGRSLGVAAAALAAAAFLASPFLILMIHSPAPFGIFLCLQIALLLGLWRFAADARLSTLVALASLAGLAASTAYLYPAIGLIGLACAFLLWKRRRLPGPKGALHVAVAYWLLPLLAFLAAAGPVLPDIEALETLFDDYAARHADLGLLEAILAGQESPFGPVTGDALWSNGRPGRFDIALGSLLSPFAVPRTTLRLWADTAFEPWSAALAAVGMAAALRAWRHPSQRASAWALIALLAASLLPAALASAYDRTSITRNLALPMTLSLFAAFGLEVLRRALLPRVARPRAALAAAALALVSGLVLFDRVTPRVLRSSARALHAEALGDGAPAGGAWSLDHAGPHPVPWLGVEWVGTHLLPRPTTWRPWNRSQSIVGPEESGPEVLLWSPALERDEDVSDALCARWPESRLFSIVDRAGVSRAWAARLAGGGARPSEWMPEVPATRFVELGCAERVDP